MRLRTNTSDDINYAGQVCGMLITILRRCFSSFFSRATCFGKVLPPMFRNGGFGDGFGIWRLGFGKCNYLVARIICLMLDARFQYGLWYSSVL